MPVEEGLLIAVKEGVVELTANVVDPGRDRAESFVERVSEVLFDHQYQAMTDPAILNPPDLGLATCLVSRDPMPDALKDGLLSLGFAPIDSEGGRADRSIFSRFQKRSRTKLDKWRTPYLRASGASARLGAFEDSLIEEVPEGSFAEIADQATRALVNAARTVFKLLLTPSTASLEQLERALLSERSQVKGRLVLHPAVVRALTAFTGDTVRQLAPASRWDEQEGPLLVDSGREDPVATDPEFRAVKFVVRGNKELLTSYVESVLSQSRS